MSSKRSSRPRNTLTAATLDLMARSSSSSAGKTEEPRIGQISRIKTRSKWSAAGLARVTRSCRDRRQTRPSRCRGAARPAVGAFSHS